MSKTHADYQREYWRRNKTRLNEQQRARYHKNKQRNNPLRRAKWALEGQKEEVRNQRRAYNKKYYETNKEAFLDYQRSWRRENKDRVKAQRKRNYERRKADGSQRLVHFWQRYRMRPNEAEQLWAAQGGRCAICRIVLSTTDYRKLHVDHCHATKKVRGFLCVPCNHGLGNFRDDPELLKSAITYLSK